MFTAGIQHIVPCESHPGSSGFQAKANRCKLVRDFTTLLGQGSHTSLLKHLANASIGTMLLESAQVIRAKFVCRTGPV